MPAKITIQFVVPIGYLQGDYAKLCSNGGSGSIDWNDSVNNDIYELFPNGAGIYGWGHAPWGHFRWGHGHSMRTPGFGHLPWGHFPWGHGTALIMAIHRVTSCGEYKYGFALYDEYGNLHEGTPDEETLNIHIAPPAPTRLTKTSYDKETDILVLSAA